MKPRRIAAEAPGGERREAGGGLPQQRVGDRRAGHRVVGRAERPAPAAGAVGRAGPGGGVGQAQDHPGQPRQRAAFGEGADEEGPGQHQGGAAQQAQHRGRRGAFAGRRGKPGQRVPGMPGRRGHGGPGPPAAPPGPPACAPGRPAQPASVPGLVGPRRARCPGSPWRPPWKGISECSILNGPHCAHGVAAGQALIGSQTKIFKFLILRSCININLFF